jgi:hypothetical protein
MYNGWVIAEEHEKVIIIVNHHHQLINVPTAGAHAFLMDTHKENGP